MKKRKCGLVKQFSIIFFLEESVFHGQIDCSDDRILYKLSNGFAIGRIIVNIIADTEFGLCFAQVILNGMQIHLVTIEIGII